MKQITQFFLEGESPTLKKHYDPDPQYIHRLSICLHSVSVSRGKLTFKIFHHGTFTCKRF